MQQAVMQSGLAAAHPKESLISASLDEGLMAARSNTQDLVDRISKRLDEVQRLRARIHADPMAGQDRRVLRAWQAERMARTYADLLQQPRYESATRFFLDEVYGANGYPMSDEEVKRILPTMSKLLPEYALRTVEAAVELDWLSERLDTALAQALREAQDDPDDPLEISAAAYVRAYRATGEPDERERQFVLLCKIGHELDRLASKPLIGTTLHLMRGPAALTGLQRLQAFLEHGFRAFQKMEGADEFLDVIAHRERLISEQIYAGRGRPFHIAESRLMPESARA
ncbi:MAG TPA: hypothetical protein VJM53_09620 [Burkholderiales bacterium]|nr:hypothetical protein [Burkholderiales bacterium]